MKEVNSDNIVENYIALKSHLDQENNLYIDSAIKLISQEKSTLGSDALLKMKLAESMENICNISLLKTSLAKQIVQGRSSRE